MRFYEIFVDETQHLSRYHDLPYRDLCFAVTQEPLDQKRLKEFWKEVHSSENFPQALREPENIQFVEFGTDISEDIIYGILDKGDIKYEVDLGVLFRYLGKRIKDLREKF